MKSIRQFFVALSYNGLHYIKVAIKRQRLTDKEREEINKELYNIKGWLWVEGSTIKCDPDIFYRERDIILKRHGLNK